MNDMEPKYLVVCLGNPGEKYRNTPHNVAWMFVDTVVKADLWHESKKAQALYAQQGDIEYIKPLTYMNNSGGAVTYAQKKHAVPTDHIIVVHDDVDLPLGQFKISQNKGAGSHNGVASVTRSLGTKGFIRIRIGVQPERLFGLLKAKRPRNTKSFVLRPFSKKSLERIEVLFPDIEEAIRRIVSGDVPGAMNTYN